MPSMRICSVGANAATEKKSRCCCSMLTVQSLCLEPKGVRALRAIQVLKVLLALKVQRGIRETLVLPERIRPDQARGSKARQAHKESKDLRDLPVRTE